MSIQMPRKKFPQISVSQDTYVSLQDLKFELRTRSINEAIEKLVEEHRQKQEMEANA